MEVVIDQQDNHDHRRKAAGKSKEDVGAGPHQQDPRQIEGDGTLDYDRREVQGAAGEAGPGGPGGEFKGGAATERRSLKREKGRGPGSRDA